MENPFAALAARLRRRPAAERPAAPSPLPETVADNAAAFQARLDDARERLRRDIPPPADPE